MNKSAVLSTILLIVFLFQTNMTFAQSKGGFGVKGGLNYNANGNYFKNAQLIMDEGFSNLGFHGGGFAKVNLGLVYIRPELIYSHLKTVIQNEKLLTQRVDVPLLLGTNFLGIVSVFAGPSFHYRLKDDLKDFNFEDVEKNFSTGYQFGLGLNIGSIGLDLRYEREIEGRSLSINNAVSGSGDFKFQQMILGLSYKF